MPPAAPAPFSSDVRRSVATAKPSSQPSTSAIRSSPIPFCGPKVLVAPKSPVSGLSTSLAATRVTPARRVAGRAEVHAGHGRQRGGAAVEHAVGRRPERGEHARATVVGAGAAEPDDDGPRSAVDGGEQQLADPAARRGLRVPVDQVQAGGLRALDVRRLAHAQHHRGHRRAVRAPTPSPPRARRRARRGGRRRSRGRRRPSARGRARRRAPCRRQPAAMASAASTAVRVPANLSGAMSTRMAAILAAATPSGMLGA